MAEDGAAWSSVLAVPAECTGSDDAALAMPDRLVCTMRHSASPTHAVGVIWLPDGAVCVAWPLATAATAGPPPLAEATRDRGSWCH